MNHSETASEITFIPNSKDVPLAKYGTSAAGVRKVLEEAREALPEFRLTPHCYENVDSEGRSYGCLVGLVHAARTKDGTLPDDVWSSERAASAFYTGNVDARRAPLECGFGDKVPYRSQEGYPEYDELYALGRELRAWIAPEFIEQGW